MLFSPVMLHFYQLSGAEIQLKTPLTSTVVSKKVIFPACQFPRARAPRDEGLYSVFSGRGGNDSDYFHFYGFSTHSALCERAINHYYLGFQICKIKKILIFSCRKCLCLGATINCPLSMSPWMQVTG